MSLATVFALVMPVLLYTLSIIAAFRITKSGLKNPMQDVKFIIALLISTFAATWTAAVYSKIGGDKVLPEKLVKASIEVGAPLFLLFSLTLAAPVMYSSAHKGVSLGIQALRKILLNLSKKP